MSKMRLSIEPSQTEHAVMQARIERLAQRRRDGAIGAAVYASQYFLCWQLALHGKRCAARKYRHDPRPDPGAWWDELQERSDEDLRERLRHYLGRYGFLGVIANVPAALCAWLRGGWPLRLCEHIPGPEEVLQMQVRGTRPVTILADYPRLLRPVLNKVNAYAFMVHDLEHAYKYFHEAQLHREQKNFFGVIDQALRRGMFDVYRRDPLFADRFDYLISDMNTHVMHSMQYLRANLVEYHLRLERKPPGGVLSPAARGEIAALMGYLSGELKWDPDRSLSMYSSVATPQPAARTLG